MDKDNAEALKIKLEYTNMPETVLLKPNTAKLSDSPGTANNKNSKTLGLPESQPELQRPQTTIDSQKVGQPGEILPCQPLDKSQPHLVKKVTDNTYLGMPILSSNTQIGGEENKPLSPKMQQQIQKELNVLNDKIEEQMSDFQQKPNQVMD